MSSKNRIKSPYCTNCGKVLNANDNFCPNCGQENDNKRQTFGKVMSHLVLDFLHLDSKAAHSLPPLLFRPGYLTNEFLKGKRQQYLDPVKMFLTIVLIYFLLASIGSHDKKNNVVLSPGVLIANGDSLLVLDKDTINIHAPDAKNNRANIDASLNKFDAQDVAEYTTIQRLVEKGIKDPVVIMDTLQVSPTLWNRFYYTEVVKFAAADMNAFKDFLISKLPWLVFCVVPIFAFLLKLLYFRRDYYYIDHLIFSFHLHTFFFLMGIMLLLSQMVLDDALNKWLLLLTILYTLFAFKNMYKQSWGKTILKSLLLAGTYMITSVITFLFLLLVIFLIF